MEVPLALALGAVLGFIAGAARVRAQVRRGRLVRKAGAALAPLLPDERPTLSLADIFANRVRVRLGGITYDLPVRNIEDNERWVRSLEGRLAAVAGAIQATDAKPEILRLLLAEHEAAYELLLSYDASGVLPPADEIARLATSNEILNAVLLIWQAADPKAAAGLVTGVTNSTPQGRTSSSPLPTAGMSAPFGAG